ncbi:MAG TPA: 5-deoxy-glucuronate isomerase [Streptosporangiaceae bacterium]|nr:5-deoxy-glucuronate isomerase [Streptosporangiaceae bacterium]
MTIQNGTLDWHLPAGSTGDGREIVRVTPEVARWGYSGLRVLDLAAGEVELGDTGGNEMIVLPLTGSCGVDTDAGGADLAGRADVFSAVTDCAYVPRDTAYRISSEHGGRFALAMARSDAEGLPFRHVKADEVRVEIRGAGACSRRVNNFGTPDVLEADRLIACEVFTPAGNWSSFPPHKHDTDRPGESVLEEIYYFEVADGPSGPGLAYQRVYGTADRPADVLAEVRSGDVVIVPHGWHGPSMAVPGYDLYYLNVMAGPGRREWLISDDPAHAWVREQWENQSVDPRVTSWSMP